MLFNYLLDLICLIVRKVEVMRFRFDIFRIVVSWGGFIGMVFPIYSQTILKDSAQKAYMWNIEGAMLYEAPSITANSAGIVPFGESVAIMDLSNTEPEEIVIYRYGIQKDLSEDYVKTYSISSNWVKIEYNDKSLYLLDTYLSRIPPPDSSMNLGFIMSDYLGAVSPLSYEKKEGRSDEFCAQTSLIFENKISYTGTDFGPCEQCGHFRERVFLPLVTYSEAVVMALFFLNVQGFFSEGNEVLLKRGKNDIVIEAYMEFGQECIVDIKEETEGSVLVMDYYM